MMTSKEDIEFLKEAQKCGNMRLIKKNYETAIWRVSVTVGNQTRPFDMTAELVRELGIFMI